MIVIQERRLEAEDIPGEQSILKIQIIVTSLVLEVQSLLIICRLVSILTLNLLFLYVKITITIFLICQDLKDVTSQVHYEKYRCEKLTSMALNKEVIQNPKYCSFIYTLLNDQNLIYIVKIIYKDFYLLVERICEIVVNFKARNYTLKIIGLDNDICFELQNCK